MLPLFLFGLRGPQLIFIALIILLLFGTSKIPEIMRNLGKGIHSFKQGIEDAKEEINREVVKADSKKPENYRASDSSDSSDKSDKSD